MTALLQLQSVSKRFFKPLDMFGMEGYLTLLVGQKVPYHRTASPGENEWQIWNGIRAQHKALAQSALTIPEAFAAISARWAQ